MAPFSLFYHFLVVKYGSFDLKGKPIFYYSLPSKLEESPCKSLTKKKKKPGWQLFIKTYYWDDDIDRLLNFSETESDHLESEGVDDNYYNVINCSDNSITGLLG